jgi:hypothetical protein
MNDNKINITDYNLFRNQYDIEILKANIEHLDINSIYKTQKLTVEFCVDYILNDDYASCDEDTYLDENNIIAYQTHLTQYDFDNYFKFKRLNNKP